MKNTYYTAENYPRKYEMYQCNQFHRFSIYKLQTFWETLSHFFSLRIVFLFIFTISVFPAMNIAYGQSFCIAILWIVFHFVVNICFSMNALNRYNGNRLRYYRWVWAHFLCGVWKKINPNSTPYACDGRAWEKEEPALN